LLRKLVGDREVDAKVLAIVERAGMPVSVEYVAHNAGLSWHTARALLFKLAAEGRVEAMNTTKSWVFMAKKGRAKAQATGGFENGRALS
jgi:DNA-binding IclR family transcriptional regulator